MENQTTMNNAAGGQSGSTDVLDAETNWKDIAMQLAQRVNFAVMHLTCTGEGLLMNIKTGTSQHWRDYMADGMELIPGLTINRELMHTFNLPRSKQKKAQAELAAKRKESNT